MTRLVLSAALALMLAACQMPTSYKAYDGRYGYAEEKVEENVYRILFSGNEHTPSDTVEDHLLRRAAELTNELGYERFTIIRSKTEKVPAKETGRQITCGPGGLFYSYAYYPEIIPSHYVGLIYIELVSETSSQPLDRQVPANEVLDWLEGCSAG